MPILEEEPCLFPDQLLEGELTFPEGEEEGRAWWVLHTRPRQEKSLARELYRRRVPFYLPQVARRSRIRGRVLTAHVPLFPGYLFLRANREEQVVALATNRVARALPVVDGAGLWGDLRQIHCLLSSGAPVALEDQLTPGATVAIRSGPLAGLKGKIVRASSGSRFIVAVDFIQQGASVLLDDFSLVRLE